MREQTREPKVLLIGGSGRSGTNITKKILSLHSRVYALPFEYRVTIDPDGLVDFYRSFASSWSPYLADRRIKRLEGLLKDLGTENSLNSLIGAVIKLFDRKGKHLTPKSYLNWSLQDSFPNYFQQVEELINALVDFRFQASWVGSEGYSFSPQLVHTGPKNKVELAGILQQFLNNLIKGCLEKNKKEVFVEDNTWNILFAEDLLDLMPQAKLLHVYRDPRDVVASLIQQKWAPNSVRETAFWYCDIMNSWKSNKARLEKNKFLELPLEGLVGDSVGVIKKICSFADLEYENQMSELDLSRSHIGRWKNDFSRAEASDIQSILKEWIQELGYKD